MATDRPGSSYYEENYPDYARQNPPAKIAFYLDLVRRRAPPGSRLFELGVGLGIFLEAAAREYRCWGCDINAFGVERTRERVPEAGVFVGSEECLLRAPPPDVVVAWDVLEHHPALPTALAAVHDRLPEGGLLIAVVPVYDGPLGWLVRLLDHDPTHVSRWSRRRWLDALRRAGFDVVERGGLVRRLVGRSYIHLTRPQWLLRLGGSALYFVARRGGRPPRGSA